MILASFPWLSVTINLLLVVFVIVCLLMVLLILMQRPKQEGLGAAFGSGVTDQVWGARTTNVLQRGTVYLASLFFLLSLLLAILYGIQNKQEGLTNPAKSAVQTTTETPATPAPATAPAATPAPVQVTPVPAPPAATPAPVTPAPAPATPPAETPAPVTPAATPPAATPAPATPEPPKTDGAGAPPP